MFHDDVHTVHKPARVVDVHGVVDEEFLSMHTSSCTMDLAYMCVKPQMRLYVCHPVRLLNSQRSSLRSFTFARFARTFFQSSELEFLSKEHSCLNIWTQSGPEMDPKWTQNGPTR